MRATFFKMQFKNSWLVVAFAIVALILWNTVVLFQTLQREEHSKMELWVMAQQEHIKNQNISNLTFEVLQRSGTNPMILVDNNGRIIHIKNIKKSDSSGLYRTLKHIKTENKPLEIYYRDSLNGLIVNQKLYYGDSVLLKKLQYYPLALLLIIFLFGSVLFFVFKTSKISEQNKLWAAMAKETAHQISTPLTSMMGWFTLSKEKEVIPILEIEKDIERLRSITDRFSKIGSKPNLIVNDIVFTVRTTADYLRKRSSAHVNFKIDLPKEPIFIPFDDQLISWSLENLIRNGIDAMKGKGLLSVSLTSTNDVIEIAINDTGTGIKREYIKRIFAPGFTTKSRGWGLGLSLAKRIVVDYHKGKISVKKTSEKGTTLSIVLKRQLQCR